MQPQNCVKLVKRFFITVVMTFCWGASGLHAAQFNYTTPVNSTGNNFTMLSVANTAIGGTNDVVFTWDGTLNDAVAGAVSNATITSDEAFFGEFWIAHDVTTYGPGTYTVFDGCLGGDAACGVGNAVNFTVGANQIGAHMLFDWGAVGAPTPCGVQNCDIDVVVVWNFNATWASQNATSPFYDGDDNGTICNGAGCVVDGLPNTEDTLFSLISSDVNGNGVAGSPMTDGAFIGASANFSFNGVTFPNLPPTANDFSRSTLANTPILIDVMPYATDPDGSLVPGSVAVVSLPTNGTAFTPGDGTVGYTPTLGFVSPPTDSFQYTINDDFGETSNPGTVTITVTTVANTPPVANDAPLTTDEDITLDITVDSVASDTDGDSLSFQNFDTTTAEGGTVTVDATNTILTYSPLADWSGTDTFSYWVTDALDSSNVATITVTVNPVNDPLVCTDVTQATPADTSLDIDVAATLLSTCDDVEGDTITLASTTQPTQPGSTLSFDGVNTLTYTPAPGFSGQDTFTYTATDGTATDTRTVVITVSAGAFGNFTMLDVDGVTFGGTNDILAIWDGSQNTAVDSTNFNMTMASASSFPFFGFPWFAHDIRVFGPGTYSFDTTCTVAQLQAGVADCGGAPDELLDLTVPAGQIGAHILFDWNVTENIDVVLLWENDGSFDNPAPGNLYQGPAGETPDATCVYELVSRDADGDGTPGAKMIDGPFIDFRANFNVNFTRPCDLGAVEVQKSSVDDPSLGGACTLRKTPVSPASRSDLFIVAGFIVWLGIGVAGRSRRQRVQ